MLHLLNQVVNVKDGIKTVSDLSFDAVDVDGSHTLEEAELGKIMKEIARESKIAAPTDADVQSVLMELGENNFDGKHVRKEGFFELINLVLGKMLESEEDFMDREVLKQEGGEEIVVDKKKVSISTLLGQVIGNQMIEKKGILSIRGKSTSPTKADNSKRDKSSSPKKKGDMLGIKKERSANIKALYNSKK